MKQLEDTRTLDMYGAPAEPDMGVPITKPLGISKAYAARKAAGHRSISLDPEALNVLEAVQERLHLRKGLRLTKSQTVGYVVYEYLRMLEGAK